MSLEGIKIHAISDTHNRHNKFTMPGGDILIHAGDATLGGKVSEVMNFLDWYAKQNYKHKIFVPGNHDWLFEENPSLCADECKNRGIILLNDSGIEIEGIKIWGSPVQPEFCSWAFNRNQIEIQPHWDMIPEDTEILITHGPAWDRLDFIPQQNKNVGCPALYKRIMETNVKLHIFGHIHESRGYTYKDGKVWVNASVLDGQYLPTEGNPKKIVKSEDGEYYVENE
jgi:Icc-related predicted phosphoesterase